MGAAIVGALLALLLAYAGSYVLTRYGLGTVTGPQGANPRGPAVFRTAALNLYAMQHVTLAGSGSQEDMVTGTSARISAQITLPLSVWVVVPAIALLIGGFAAGKMRPGCGRWGIAAGAVLAGLIYALVLAGASRLIYAPISAFAIPQIGDMGSQPPAVPFHGTWKTTLIFAGSFGIVFGFIGSLMAVRGLSAKSEPGVWWTCGKAAVISALLVQILLAGGFYAWSLRKAQPEDERKAPAVVLPMVSGIGYTLIHGQPLLASVESRVKVDNSTIRTLHVRANLYTGIHGRDLRGEPLRVKQSTRISVIAVAVVIGALAALFAGWLAAGWLPHEGPALPAARVAILHTGYLAALIGLCSMELIQSDPVSVSTILVKPLYGIKLACSFGGVLIFALIGAAMGRRKSSSSKGAAV